MSSLSIGRLTIGPPWQWHEAIGDPVTNLGGAVIPAPRQALRHLIDVGTYAADGATDTVAARLTIRRQLRAMFNNTQLKLQGFFYVVYSDDPEQNGWYVPDFGQLADVEASAGLATGVWKLEQVAWILQGHKRTNREARNVWMKDLRTGLPWRDTLKFVYSTDFSALPSLLLTTLPNGATQIMNAVSRAVAVPVAMPTGRDGGVCQLIQNQPDLACVSFERLESALNDSDVIVYDRRGTVTLPEAGGNSNLYTNPRASVNVAGFTGHGGVTVTQDTPAIAPPQGTTAFKLTGDGANNIQFSSNKTTTGIRDGVVVGGSTYTATASILAGSTGRSFDLRIDWYDATNTLISSTSGASQNDNAAGYTRLVATGAAPATAVSYTLFWLEQSGTPANGEVHWITCIQMTQTSAAVAYADGDTPGWMWAGLTGLSASSIDPQAFGWEEVGGPDYPWSWQGTTPTLHDTPVLDNGLVRVRYDSTNTPGFRVDIWNGSTYAEQGKMVVERIGDVTGYCDTWVAAGIHLDQGYTPDLATIAVVLANSADTSSRELVFITLQRGKISASFECYPALKADGVTRADAILQWTPALNAGAADLNQSAAKVDSQGTGSWTPGAAGTAVYVATAGTGAGPGKSGQFGALAALGNANFTTSENWAAILRYPTTFNVVGAYQHTLVVLQAAQAQAKYGGASSTAYGVATDTYQVLSQSAAGYIQCQVQFSPTVAQQVMEAESMNLGANTTAGGDPSASGAATTQTARVTDANPHVTQATWPNGFLATYRVFARVKTTATQMSCYAKTGATTGATRTLAGAATPTYTWLDLGEIVANNTTFELHAWISSGAGVVEVDRIEAVLVQDKARTNAIFSGARDAAQSALQDSRTFGSVVAR